MNAARLALSAVMAAQLGLSGCTRVRASPAPARPLRLATTTSVENSGLLEVLLTAFRDRTGIEVHVLSMGTGKALRTARDGNCDVVLVHDEQAERQFMSEGWGACRRQVMHNDFVLLGPEADPAGVRSAPSAAHAMRLIAQAGRAFVSRGDSSGTHRKEMDLWQSAGVAPAGQWYRSAGRGMGETLTMADEMNAYALCDRATVTAFRAKLGLRVLLEGDPALHNPYSVIAVSPRAHPQVNHAGAMSLVEFLTCQDGRRLIGDYRVRGEALFHPSPPGEGNLPQEGGPVSR